MTSKPKKPGRQRTLKLRIRNSPVRQVKQGRNRGNRQVARALTEMGRQYRHHMDQRQNGQR